eukprot:Blabericola_migrator_1__2329@NODE_164_length_12331_cov_134_122880_g142_i0_p15_GENE_NODE_164_length_12331_cov_134_122880_g142_i0NODE_164_length_12331_cov_134_122880_g142_i0_p15_ORF_typecomplete_len102_score8_32_NODE_164_length_12331_cov_134_122880_g142_i07771082
MYDLAVAGFGMSNSVRAQSRTAALGAGAECLRAYACECSVESSILRSSAEGLASPRSTKPPNTTDILMASLLKSLGFISQTSETCLCATKCAPTSHRARTS